MIKIGPPNVFNQLHDSFAVEIAEMCCDWLKHEQKVIVSVAGLYNRKTVHQKLQPSAHLLASNSTVLEFYLKSCPIMG